MSICKYFVNCLLLITKSSSVLIVNNMITSTKFFDINDDVQFMSYRIMIQNAKYREIKKMC